MWIPQRAQPQLLTPSMMLTSIQLIIVLSVTPYQIFWMRKTSLFAISVIKGLVSAMLTMQYTDSCNTHSHAHTHTTHMLDTTHVCTLHSIHTHADAHAHVHTQMHAHVHTRTHAHVHTWTHTHTCVRAPAHTTHTCPCTHAHTHALMQPHKHKLINIHKVMIGGLLNLCAASSYWSTYFHLF